MVEKNTSFQELLSELRENPQLQGLCDQLMESLDTLDQVERELYVPTVYQRLIADDFI